SNPRQMEVEQALGPLRCSAEPLAHASHQAGGCHDMMDDRSPYAESVRLDLECLAPQPRNLKIQTPFFAAAALFPATRALLYTFQGNDESCKHKTPTV